MAIKKHSVKVKVLDGWMGLRRSFVVEGSIRINGEPLPDSMEVNYRIAAIRWKDQENLGDKGPYDIEYEYDDKNERQHFGALAPDISPHRGKKFASLPAAMKYNILAKALGIVDDEGRLI